MQKESKQSANGISSGVMPSSVSVFFQVFKSNLGIIFRCRFQHFSGKCNGGKPSWIVLALIALYVHYQSLCGLVSVK